jgi:hypothetical protein
MKIYLSFAALFIILFNASCSKNNDSQNNTISTPNTTRLQRYIALDGQDTVVKCNYSYDSQHRIAQSDKLFYEDGLPSYNAIAVFSYNGNDSVQSRVDYRLVDISGSSPDEMCTEYFVYDAAGKLLHDSIDLDQGSLGYHFSYFNDHFRVTTNFGDTVDCHQTIVNGNLMTETDSIFGVHTAGSSVNIQNSFDNHPNPFYYTDIKRVLQHMPENFLQDDEFPAFANNLLDMSSVNPVSTYHTTFTYTYNAEGYPVTAAMHDHIHNDHFTAFYFYQ